MGVLLYRALSGRLPYRASNVVELMLLLRAGKADPIGDVVTVDPALAAIVTKATEWDAAARFQSAREFQSAPLDWLATSSRVDHLLTDFLDVPVLARRPQRTPPPRAPSLAPSGATSSATARSPSVATLSAPSSDRGEAPRDVEVAPTSPSSSQSPVRKLPPPRTPARKKAARRLDSRPPKVAAAVEADEETTVRKLDPTPKRPLRS